MIDIIINSYKEPKATLRAVEAFLKQDIKQDFRVTVVDPFPEVETFLRKHIKDPRFNFFLDPGEGKSYSLNLIFQELGSQDPEDIFILTDGDVYVSDNAVAKIMEAFKDKEVGCVTGKPVSIDPRDSKYGYWSHFLFDGIDMVRKRLSAQKEFFECSGYLFAIRKGIIMEIPLETSEDSIIPYLFWKEDYKVAYAESAEVYVKNPDNWEDWLNQKIRNIKAHEALNKIAPDMPRTKSFFNEAREGFFIFSHAKSFKEFFYGMQLYIARLYIYLKAFSELKKKGYEPGWRETETESTKPLD